ncbi:hypothetical protein CF336_g4294 [Tilletia laevis]|nr:hypothetical protein CF336_g4294 [Tilletia laevis]KAE8202354.1 hypothetical protein CF335_g3453 [Tilletia laevis]
MLIARSSLLLLLALLPSLVPAATISRTALLKRDDPNCPTNCASQALSAAGCASSSDFRCLCNSQEYVDNSTLCIRKRCPGLLDQAIQVNRQLCASMRSFSDETPSGKAGQNQAEGLWHWADIDTFGTPQNPADGQQRQQPTKSDLGTTHSNPMPSPDETASIKLRPGTIEPWSAAPANTGTTVASGTTLPVFGTGTLAPVKSSAPPLLDTRNVFASFLVIGWLLL